MATPPLGEPFVWDVNGYTADGNVERDPRGNPLPTMYHDWSRAVAAAQFRAHVTGIRRQVYRDGGQWHVVPVDLSRYDVELLDSALWTFVTITDRQTGDSARGKALTLTAARLAAWRGIRQMQLMRR